MYGFFAVGLFQMGKPVNFITSKPKIIFSGNFKKKIMSMLDYLLTDKLKIILLGFLAILEKI